MNRVSLVIWEQILYVIFKVIDEVWVWLLYLLPVNFFAALIVHKILKAHLLPLFFHDHNFLFQIAHLLSQSTLHLIHHFLQCAKHFHRAIICWAMRCLFPSPVKMAVSDGLWLEINHIFFAVVRQWMEIFIFVIWYRSERISQFFLLLLSNHFWGL